MCQTNWMHFSCGHSERHGFHYCVRYHETGILCCGFQAKEANGHLELVEKTVRSSTGVPRKVVGFGPAPRHDSGALQFSSKMSTEWYNADRQRTKRLVPVPVVTNNGLKVEGSCPECRVLAAENNGCSEAELEAMKLDLEEELRAEIVKSFDQGGVDLVVEKAVMVADEAVLAAEDAVAVAEKAVLVADPAVEQVTVANGEENVLEDQASKSDQTGEIETSEDGSDSTFQDYDEDFDDIVLVPTSTLR